MDMTPAHRRQLTQVTCLLVRDFNIEAQSLIISPFSSYFVLSLRERVETIMISIYLSVVLHLVFALGFIQLSQAQNLQFGEWQQINYTASPLISARNLHSGALLTSTNEYLVFGGRWIPFFSDIHSINLTSLQSTQLAASTPLGGRYEMAYTSDLNSNFWVHGGFDGVGNLFTYGSMIQVSLSL
jgi:hypothetical protein